MQRSKMQLENYFVEEVSFALQNDKLENLEEMPQLESEDLAIEVGLGESKDDEYKRFCQLTVELREETAEQYPYEFKIQLLGFFNLDSSATEDELDMLITNAAPTMLYTAAREYLLLITGRTRFLPVTLPTVFFAPQTKDRSEETKTPAKEKSAPAKKAKPKTPAKKKPTKKTK